VAIRRYEGTDGAAVAALWRETLPDAAPHNDPAKSIRRQLAVDRDLFLVAVVDGTVVGTVMGGYDGYRGWVYAFAVAPRHRREGVGSNLVRSLEAQLAAQGCPKVNLQVRSSNAAVVKFYEWLG
jgi:ribosomal protein S18 acetylase RimI-like enzyme